MKNPDSLTDPLPPTQDPLQRNPRAGHRHRGRPYEILDAAQQRIHAASDLLETLYCLCFKQADASDIPKIVSALYLLTQDGNELLEVARQRLPKLTG